MEINTNEVFLPLVHKVQSYAGKNTGDDGAGPLSPLHKGKVQKNNLLILFLPLRFKHQFISLFNSLTESIFHLWYIKKLQDDLLKITFVGGNKPINILRVMTVLKKF